MSRHQTIRAIRAEIERLNRDIDLKIIRGINYAREARRHKYLMSQLSHLAPSRFGWVSSSFKLVRMSVF